MSKIYPNPKNYKQTQVVNADGDVQVMHPETNAGNVLFDKTIGEETIKTVEEALERVFENADAAEEAIEKAQSTADEAKSIAEGRTKTKSFATYDAMKEYLKSASSTELQIGWNLYIRQTGVPDYWVSGILSDNTGEYGYYEIDELETEKVDLTDYQTKEDNALNTDSKSVVGAINEVKESVDKIKNGTTAAGKADKLSTKKTFKLEGDVVGTVDTDLESGMTMEVNLSDVGEEGTYSAVKVDSKGRVIGGGRVMAIIGAEDPIPEDVVVGGLVFIAKE